MENFVSLLDLYKFMTHEDSIHVGAEYEILSIINSELKWLLLTDEEKQAKRVRIIQKVSLSLAKDRKDTFLLEETINLVYSLCDETINKIDQNKGELEIDKLLTRLKAMLVVEKILINEHFDAKKIRCFNFEKLDNILNEVITSNQHQKFNEEIDLKLLKEKVHLKYQLLNTPQEPLN